MDNRRTIGWLILFFLPLLSNGQSKDSFKKLTKEMGAFFQENDWFMELEYFEKKRGRASFVPTGKGSVEKRDELRKTIFKDYEVLASNSFYVKVDHTKKLMYVILGNEGKLVNEPQHQEVMQFFDETQLLQYKLQYDTIASDSDSGLYVYSGIGKSVYHSIRLRVDIETHLPSSYLIQYSEWASSETEAIKVHFKSIKQSSEQEEGLFRINHYVNIENEPITLSKQYKDYKIVKNFN